MSAASGRSSTWRSLEERRTGDPLFLQTRSRPGPSVYETFLGASQYPHHGQRVDQRAAHDSERHRHVRGLDDERRQGLLRASVAGRQGHPKGRDDRQSGWQDSPGRADGCWLARTPAAATPPRSPTIWVRAPASRTHSQRSRSHTPTRTSATTRSLWAPSPPGRSPAPWGRDSQPGCHWWAGNSRLVVRRCQPRLLERFLARRSSLSSEFSSPSRT